MTPPEAPAYCLELWYDLDFSKSVPPEYVPVSRSTLPAFTDS